MMGDGRVFQGSGEIVGWELARGPRRTEENRKDGAK